MESGRHAELLERLRQTATRVAEGAGLEVVELKLRGSSQRRSLRVDIDRVGPIGVDLDDCRRISDLLGQELEHDDVIPGSYVLEVSSPGVDRPIETDDDVRRNVGRRVFVTTSEPIDGRREFRGRLTESEAGELRVVEDDEQVFSIPFSAVLKARQDTEF